MITFCDFVEWWYFSYMEILKHNCKTAFDMVDLPLIVERKN